MNKADQPARLGLLGGSFDPPHLGHVALARAAFRTGLVSRIVFVPCFSHAFDKRMTDFEVRLEMLRLACRECDFPFEISVVERTLGEPSRTFCTVSRLREMLPGAEFRLIVGSDILEESAKWYRWSDLVAIAPPLVASRPGYATADLAGMPAVSSSEVRRRIREGLPVSDLIHPLVEDYICRQGLYHDKV